MGMGVGPAYPQVAIQRLRSLTTERTGPGAATLAHDVDDITVEVHIVDLQAHQLVQPCPGVEEQPEKGLVAAVVERLAVARLEDGANLVQVELLDRLLGHGRRVHLLHRRRRNLAFVDEPLEERGQGSVPVVGGRRLVARQLIGDEGLDVLATDVHRHRRHACGGQEAFEPLRRRHVGLDSLRSLVVCSQ